MQLLLGKEVTQRYWNQHDEINDHGPVVMDVRMRALESGQVLEVRVNDPAARLGVPAWSRLTGHTHLATIEDDDRRTRFFLRKR